MLLVLVLTTLLTLSKLLVRSPVAALRVNSEVEMPGIAAVVVRR